MADNNSKEERSRNMVAIRSKNTKPEVYLRKPLYEHGYRYRKSYFIRKYRMPRCSNYDNYYTGRNLLITID